MRVELQKQIELARWLILKTAGNSGYLGATETMIAAVLDGEVALSKQQLRTEIDYLENRKLVTTKRDEVKPWRIFLSRHGRDIVDYQVDCEPGIARPKLPPDLAI